MIEDLLRRMRQVARRAHWILVLLIVILAAFYGMSAEEALALFVLLLAGACTVAALLALHHNQSWWEWIVPNPFKQPNWVQLALAVMLIIVTYGILGTYQGITRLVEWIVETTSGDPDLTTCALVCLFVLIACASIWGLRWYQIRKIKHYDPSTLEQQVDVYQHSLGYWSSATEIVAIAFITLIPAALLANWAFTLLSSVLLPLFVLSIKHAHPTSEGSEGSDARQS